jgi:hypothetical protein
MSGISKRLLSIAGFAALGLSALVLMTSAPAGAQDYNKQGLQPPPDQYYSQYARKNGMFLNIGNIAYVRVPTIRLRTGAVKFREVQAANNGGVGHFVTSVGHFRPGPSSYGKQQRILIPVKTPYYYKPYGNGGPFYGQPYVYVADYYGMNGYGMPNGRLQGGQLGYGGYGFNMAQALQGLPQQGSSGTQRQPSYQGSFNAPKPMMAVPQQPQRPVAQPRIVQFNGATVKSGNMPMVLKPAGKNFLRVE